MQYPHSTTVTAKEQRFFFNCGHFKFIYICELKNKLNEIQILVLWNELPENVLRCVAYR